MVMIHKIIPQALATSTGKMQQSEFINDSKCSSTVKTAHSKQTIIVSVCLALTMNSINITRQHLVVLSLQRAYVTASFLQYIMMCLQHTRYSLINKHIYST